MNKALEFAREVVEHDDSLLVITSLEKLEVIVYSGKWWNYPEVGIIENTYDTEEIAGVLKTLAVT